MSGAISPRALGLLLLEQCRVFSADAEKCLRLIDMGADLNQKDSRNGTPLMYAASWRHTKIAFALIKAGAKLDEKDCDGYTALIRAALAMDGAPEIVTALLEKGANPYKKNKSGETALTVARNNEQSLTADILSAHITKERFDKASAKTAKTMSAIDRAAHKGIEEARQTPVVPVMKKQAFRP